MKTTTWKPGQVVIATSGKHAGQSGVVQHSDKSITTVRFCAENLAVVVDPVWTNQLQPAPDEN